MRLAAATAEEGGTGEGSMAGRLRIVGNLRKRVSKLLRVVLVTQRCKPRLNPLDLLQKGDCKALKRLIQEDPGLINERWDREGNTVLISASMQGDSRLVAWLLKRPGVDVDVQNKFGWSALYEAAAQGEMQVLRLLLSAGADETIRATSWPRQTPLEMVRQLNKVLPVRMLEAAEKIRLLDRVRALTGAIKEPAKHVWQSQDTTYDVVVPRCRDKQHPLHSSTFLSSSLSSSCVSSSLNTSSSSASWSPPKDDTHTPTATFSPILPSTTAYKHAVPSPLDLNVLPPSPTATAPYSSALPSREESMTVREEGVNGCGGGSGGGSAICTRADKEGARADTVGGCDEGKGVAGEGSAHVCEHTHTPSWLQQRVAEGIELPRVEVKAVSCPHAPTPKRAQGGDNGTPQHTRTQGSGDVCDTHTDVPGEKSEGGEEGRREECDSEKQSCGSPLLSSLSSTSTSVGAMTSSSSTSSFLSASAAPSTPTTISSSSTFSLMPSPLSALKGGGMMKCDDTSCNGRCEVRGEEYKEDILDLHHDSTDNTSNTPRDTELPQYPTILYRRMPTGLPNMTMFSRPRASPRWQTEAESRGDGVASRSVGEEAVVATVEYVVREMSDELWMRVRALMA